MLLDQAVTFFERAQHPETWLDSLRELLPRRPGRNWTAELAEAARLERKREKLLDLYLGEVVTRDGLHGRLDKLEREVLAQAERMRALRAGRRQAEEPRRLLEQTQALVAHAGAGGDRPGAPPQEQEKLLRGLIDRIEIWQEGGDKWIHIVWREDRLADRDTS